MKWVRWFGPLKEMVIKEFIQIFRDPATIRMLFLMPFLQVLLFGYVVNLNVNHIPLAIFDLDNSVQSRDLTARFLSSKYFDAAAYIDTNHQAVKLINQFKVKGVLKIDHGFGGEILGRETAPVQLILDGTISNSTGITLNYANQIVQEYNEYLQNKEAGELPARIPPPGGVTMDPVAWFNPNLETRYYYLPALVGLIVMTATVTLASMAVVREKEIGTIEQILVTPISKLQFILGKTIPFALIGLFSAAVIAAVSVFWFHVPIRGSVWLLFFGTVLFVLCTLGAGLLISTISQTQQQAMLVSFLFQNPFMQFSGFVFPISNMPRIVRWFTYLNPLRYYLIILRGVFLKGIGISILWVQFLGLAILAFGILGLAVMRFQKTVG
ncbi:MAG: ABC transporter permease [Candidatus Eremiobacteraeota bacterium]|jgi:ABC-2 type transport system permease protein|nr:ABC transporter permease [Candidatus Eremiobacteraeota bacterium]MCL5055599.1 ABC transporter permease [Bacillota bacterium]